MMSWKGRMNGYQLDLRGNGAHGKVLMGSRWRGIGKVLTLPSQTASSRPTAGRRYCYRQAQRNNGLNHMYACSMLSNNACGPIIEMKTLNPSSHGRKRRVMTAVPMTPSLPSLPFFLSLHSRRPILTNGTSSLISHAVGIGNEYLGDLAIYIQQSLDPVVLGSTTAASFKLFLVCAAVGWLLKKGRLPNVTASVLSLVSFQLLIPCMLFSRVASTLATAPDAMLLLGMACAAVTQILIGGFWGTILAPLVEGNIPKSLRIFGWHPLQPAKSAVIIASATANATGAPHATAALLPKPTPPPQGLRELIIAACAFGNTFTLPAVFFLSLLPEALGNTAIAYSGLFLLAWSPCMWSIGLSIVEGGFGSGKTNVDDKAKVDQEANSIPDNAIGSECKMPGRVFQSSIHNDFNEQNKTHKFSPAEILRQLKETKVFIKVLVFVRRVLNPPVLSIMAGMLMGLTSIGKQIFFAASGHSPVDTAMTALHNLPVELMLLKSLLRNAYEVIEMLAAGTLGMQTLVLAASLLQRVEPSGTDDSIENTQQSDFSSGESSSDKKEITSFLSTIWRALAPINAKEGRALAVLCIVRFLLLPVTCLIVWKWTCSLGRTFAPLGSMIESLSMDPLFLFIIAVQSVMPSAQNLIIMLQLSPKTRQAAPAFARMLLKLYAYAVLPVTLWVTAYASRLAVPLA